MMIKMEDKQRLVLCSVNSKYIHSSLSVYCLKSFVPKDDFNCIVYESTINEKTEKQISDIINLQPDFIGFSSYIWNIERVLELAKKIKRRLPLCYVILGGPEVSFCSGKILKENPFVDYVICGEGEVPLSHLLCRIRDGKEPADGLGITRRLRGEIIEAPPYIMKQDTVSPYDENFLSSLQGRIAYIESSRGCPFSCAFCLSGRYGNVRYFDIDRIKKEILLLSKSGTKTIKFVDRTFNANKRRALEIIEFINNNYGKEIPQGVCFHFEIAGDILDDDMLKAFGDVPHGAVQLEIGFQSFNEKTLAAVNRKTDTKRLYRNVCKLIKGGNMHIHTDLIAGLPFEDLKSFEETFNKAYFLKAHMLQMGFLKLLHGAPMREDIARYPCKFSENPPYEVLSTPYLTSEELQLLHCTEDALDRLYNSGRFKRTLSYLTDVCKINPFELFSDFGKFTDKKTNGISLDEYTAMFISFLKRYDCINSDKLRDLLVCDRLASVKGGKVPKILQIPDRRYKAVKREFLKRNIKSCAVLCSENSAVFADYTNYNPVEKEYKLNKISLSDLLD